MTRRAWSGDPAGSPLLPRRAWSCVSAGTPLLPRRAWLAVLFAAVFNGILTAAARYRLSYDAYTHMLFADHYRLGWWSLWDPHWYAGFSVTTYPPLVHQIIGLLGHLVGVDAGYALVLWVVLATYPLAVYAFSHVFVGRSAAGYAALGAAFLPALYLAAFTFGQLPTLTSTLFALFCAAALGEFLRTGSRLSGALAMMLVAAVMAAHHATLLFLPWLIFAVGLHLLLNRQVRWQPILTRLAVFGLLAALAGLLVIWPFWRWGLGQPMQTPIDHPTRHNFFADAFAAFLFFWSPYGILAAVIPFALWKGLDKRFTAPAAAFLVLWLLGLGGTTPLPRLLFGPGWAWLTYDRFAFWATLFLLPFFGAWLVLAKRTIPSLYRRSLYRLSFAVIFTLLAALALLNGLYPTILPTQPKPLDMQPIVDFLAQSGIAQNGRAQWRYLTFGFGDQFAYLNRLTAATTIDGSYHTARDLPELRASGIGSIDSAYWLPGGMTALDGILQSAGKYSVRWGFVDDHKYDYSAALLRNGWAERTTLSDGVEVWENPQATPSQPSAPPPDDPLESFSWGTLPLLALAVTAGLAGLRLRPLLTERLLLRLHTLAIGLLPVGLVFWYFRQLTAIDIPRVYFAYNNALVYASDMIAVVAVLAWGMARLANLTPPQPSPLRKMGEGMEKDSSSPPRLFNGEGRKKKLLKSRSPFHGEGDLGGEVAQGNYESRINGISRPPVPRAGSPGLKKRSQNLQVFGRISFAWRFLAPGNEGNQAHLTNHWPRFFSPGLPALGTGGHKRMSLSNLFSSLAPWLFALCLLASLSILWSKDWRESLYISLHLWLGFGLFLSLRDRPKTWTAAALGFCLALGIQAITGLFEYASQTTGFLAPLKIVWPGVLDPAMRGASVVQLRDGTRWLRAYGTLPHPNILGTFIVGFLAAPLAFFLTGRRLRIWALLLFAAGLVLLILTFSRGAWIGFLAGAGVVLLKYRHFIRQRVVALSIVGAVSLTVGALPVRGLIFTRVGETGSVPTEVFSLRGRAWLAGQAIDAIRQHPLLGLGAGSFVLNLAQHASVGYIIEPAHSLPLLVFGELGIGGMLVLTGLCITAAIGVWRSRSPAAILFGAALAGLLVTSLFDHSLWSLAPGRMLLFLILGLWAGQVERVSR